MIATLAESGTTESKSDDTDIVPMETMRAELLKKSSILSGMYPEVCYILSYVIKYVVSVVINYVMSDVINYVMSDVINYVIS